jgi:hypothetical protein
MTETITLIEAFQKITLTVIPERYRQRHLTPLTLV